VDLARDAEEVAGHLDEMVPPADEPENAVLVDNARVVRWPQLPIWLHHAGRDLLDIVAVLHPPDQRDAGPPV
jgi:hypothetical protein